MTTENTEPAPAAPAAENTSPTPPGQDTWLRRLGRRLAGAPVDRKELLNMLAEAGEAGLLEQEALWMMKGALNVSEIQVRDIMIPRSQMVVLDDDDSLEELLAKVVESGHSRFPVIAESKDEIVGILLAKDLLRHALKNGESAGAATAEPFNLKKLVRPAVFVPESKRVNVLLRDFRASRNHMAAVVDEYGGISGLVTIEDALEQIVGDIDDEHDATDGAYILRQDAGHYLVRGLTPIEEFNQYFGARFSDEEFDTVAGLVIHEFAHMPRRGEACEIGDYRFQVQRADSRRLHLLQVSKVSGLSASQDAQQSE